MESKIYHVFAAWNLPKIIASKAALVLAVLAVGCQSKPSSPSTGSEFCELTSQQRMRLERRAAIGDRGAAVRLFEYYAFARRDATRAQRWRKRMQELERR